MTKRLEILKQSLAKKEARRDEMIDNHIATVKLANGQPLNDKRNGYNLRRTIEHKIAGDAIHQLIDAGMLIQHTLCVDGEERIYYDFLPLLKETF